MESVSARRARWSLSSGAFERLLAALDPADRNHAGERYIQICAKLETFFRYSGLPEREDLIDETLDRLARRLGDGGIQAGDLMPFVRGIARKVASEAHRRDERTTSLEEIPEPLWIRSPRASAQDEISLAY